MKVPHALPWIGEEEYEAIRACFDAAWITEGPKSEEFQRRLSELMDARFAALAPNGTLALYLALRAVGIGPGDEVLVPDITFIASANAVEMTGATPVFVDVNARDYHVDPASAERWLTSRTRAVMPVHLWGTAAEMEPVLSFAREQGLSVVEDAAQAIGVRHHGRHAGTFGQAGAVSFFADKSLTTGEGGLVVTDDEEIHARLLYLRNQGRKERGSFVHPEVGYNFRMTDLQAAVGLVQLDKLPRIIERKQAIVARYRELLSGVGEVEWFRPPPGSDWVPFRVPLLCRRAAGLIEHLQAKGIEPRTWFHPLHRQPCYAGLVAKQLRGAPASGAFPNADHAHEHGVCLPVYPTLTGEQVDYVCEHVRSFYAR